MQNFKVGDKVRMSDDYIQTLSAADRSGMRRRKYTVTAVSYPFGKAEGQHVEMIDGSHSKATTTASWLTTAE